MDKRLLVLLLLLIRKRWSMFLDIGFFGDKLWLKVINYFISVHYIKGGKNMKQNYEEVPNIITGKDLDYLSDMFQWNYGALKSTKAAINEVSDQDLLAVFNKASDLFKNNMERVLDVLNNGGQYE